MMTIIEIFLCLLMFGAVSPNVETWQSHLDTGDTGPWSNYKVDTNLTQCLGSCLCSEAMADCSYRGLESLPHPVDGEHEGSFTIHILDLTGNKIQDISEEALRKYPHLKTLILRNNMLLEIPSAVSFLKILTNLQLGGNNISSLSSGVQLPSSLTNLGLEKNKIENVPPNIFRSLSKLSILNLAHNHLTSVSEGSLQGLAKLQILVLEGNRLNTTYLHPNIFNGLNDLAILELNNNFLTEVPSSISSLQKLERIFLQQIELRGNPIHYFHSSAFVNLPLLNKLQMLGSPTRVMNKFPNLTGTPNLELIHLDGLNLETIPHDLCSAASKLHTLRLRSNKLQHLPILENCTDLVQLDLGLNQIRSFEGSPFKTLIKLQDLLMNKNDLDYISEKSFVGLPHLQILDLEENNITEIHPDAFLPLNNLKDLNVGQNHFGLLPHQGLKTIIELKAHNNPKLKEFPKAESFPHIRVVRPSYAYHCCLFLPSTYENIVHEYADFGDLSENVFFPGEFDMSQFGNQTMSNVIWTNSGNLTGQIGEELSVDLWENFVSGMSNYPDYDADSISFFKPHEGIDCYPAPGPFLPCNDLFDWWTLRCGVWVVFLLALLGNGCVVVVLSFSRNKMDVPRFLVCNLAAADFFMGLYLGFLAVLDASTLGEFREYAIQWQLSAACEIAGFFGVLSSELSVFTLAVITLERNYAITHAMHLNKRLSLKHAAYIMGAAWSFSILMASLPLFGISDYRKFAVCLPFETEDAISKGYVIFLMVINGVAFFILMGCYLKMYCAIRGSQAWNSNDSKIAKRMALLVFTDFICWFPIAFFATTAACGLQLISLEGAKVFTVFVLPLNSCCNPFLYAILTKQFKKDCVMICKTIEESRVTRGIGRCRHSSNFSNRQTPANTNSLNSGSGSGSHTKNSVHCNCNVKKVKKITPRWPLDKIKSLLCGYKDVDEFNSQNEWNYQIAEIQQKQQKTKRQQSLTSSDNFSSSRSDSIKHGHCMPLRFVVNHPRRRNSWTVTRKTSQDSNLSSSRNDSAASNSTQSTNTWRMSHSSVSSEMSNSIGRTGSGYSDKSANGSKFDALARAQALHRQGSRGTSPLAAGVTSIIKQNSSSQLVSSGKAGSHTYMVRGKPRLIRQVAIQDPEMASGGSSGKSVSFKDTHDSCPVHHHQEHPGYVERFRTLYAKLTESSHEDEEAEAAADTAPNTTATSEGAEDSLNISDNKLTPKTDPNDHPSATPAPVLTLVTEEGNTIRPEFDSKRDRRVSLGTGTLPRDHDTTARDTLIKHGGSLTNLKGLAEPKYGPQKCTSENALLALQSKFGYSFKSAATGSGCGIKGVNHSRSENVLVEKCDVEETESLLGSNMKKNKSRSPTMEAVERTRSPSSSRLQSPSIDNIQDRKTPTIEEEPSENDKFL